MYACFPFRKLLCRKYLHANFSTSVFLLNIQSIVDNIFPNSVMCAYLMIFCWTKSSSFAIKRKKTPSVDILAVLKFKFIKTSRINKTTVELVDKIKYMIHYSVMKRWHFQYSLKFTCYSSKYSVFFKF